MVNKKYVLASVDYKRIVVIFPTPLLLQFITSTTAWRGGNVLTSVCLLVNRITPKVMLGL